VSFPANLDATAAGDPGYVRCFAFDLVDERGIDAVHEASGHLGRGGAQHGEDGDRDDDAGDRVGTVESGPDSECSDDDGERGEAVGTGVVAVAHALLRPGGRYVVCDIQPFTGCARALNPLVGQVLGTLFGWHADLRVPSHLRSIFRNVDAAEHAAGAVFVAMSRRIS